MISMAIENSEQLQNLSKVNPEKNGNLKCQKRLFGQRVPHGHVVYAFSDLMIVSRCAVKFQPLMCAFHVALQSDNPGSFVRTDLTL